MMQLQQIVAQLRRKASRMVVGGFRPPEQPDASWFGRVRLARPEEPWPSHGARPMIPLCQLNLKEAPYVPAALSDIALLTVFISARSLPLDRPNGDGWELRAYSSLDGLVEIDAPRHGSHIRPLPIRWELIDADYPCWEDAVSVVPANVSEEYLDLFENAPDSKVGGWPTLLQSEIYWAPFNRHPANPTYAFQIDSEEKAGWMWGDAGVGYFGRGTGEAAATWTLAWQCY